MAGFGAEYVMHRVGVFGQQFVWYERLDCSREAAAVHSPSAFAFEYFFAYGQRDRDALLGDVFVGIAVLAEHP